MRSTSFVAVALCAFASTAYSAPTPQLSNIIGSITNPGAGNNNKFEGIANGNGNDNGNHNEAGNNNGNNNEAGNHNSAGNGNKATFPSLSGILKERDAEPGMLDGLKGITNTIGSITNPTAGSGNSFKDIANGNGNGNGNGNSAGNGNGNGNSAGNGNQAGNGNTVSVSPDTTLPNIVLPNIELPDINFSPTIK